MICICERVKSGHWFSFCRAFNLSAKMALSQCCGSRRGFLSIKLSDMGVTALSSAVFCHLSSSLRIEALQQTHTMFTQQVQIVMNISSLVQKQHGMQRKPRSIAFSQFVKSSFVCASESLILTPTFQECF